MNFDFIPYLSLFGGVFILTALFYVIYKQLWKSKAQEYSSRLTEAERTYTALYQNLEELRQAYHEEHERRIILEEKSSRISLLEQTIESQRKEIEDLKTHNTSLHFALKQEKQNTGEKVKLIEKAQVDFQNAFKALSAEALSNNNQSFLHLAKSTLGAFQEAAKTDIKATEKTFSDLVVPVKEALGTVNKRIEEMEKSRVGAYEGLKEQVSHLMISQKDLRSETANLVKALRVPSVRGRWGEMQLRRVVEMSGMSSHCDFIEQVSLEGDEGRLRPDMIVSLPNQKQIIIDSKVPLAAYLEAIEAPSETLRTSHLKDHARQVKAHIHALSSRAYWNYLPKDGNSPEFVVLFLPGDTFFSAALEQDPTLIEEGVQKNVIIATPATLIALLHAVAYGWRQESLADNAREISKLGRELYKRCADMGAHMAKLGKDLSQAVGSYNKTIGSLESRILPSARKFKDLHAATRDEVPSLSSIDKIPRSLQASEMLEQKEAG